MKGSVYHAILASIANTGCLDEFESEYFVFEPPINPTTGAAYGISSQKYQIAYQQALAEHPGMEATSQAEVDLANTMVEALLHHCGNTSESISQLLEWGTAEISHFVEYEGLGPQDQPQNRGLENNIFQRFARRDHHVPNQQDELRFFGGFLSIFQSSGNR